MSLPNVLRKDNQLLIVLFGSLFTALLIWVVLVYNLLPFTLVALVLPLDLILKTKFKMRLNTRFIFYLILFFILEEIIGPTPWNPLPLSKIELIFLIGLNLFSAIRNKFKICFSKSLTMLWFIIIAFIVNDFIATMYVYDSVYVLETSLLAFCKYFFLVLYIINEQIPENQVRNLLKAFFPILLAGTVISILQALGVNSMFWFRGIYDIEERTGFSRTIGYFPYPIEFANHNVILFCLYFFTNQYSQQKSKLFLIATVLTILNVALTQTRMAIVALIFIVLIDRLKSFKSVIKYIVSITFITLVTIQILPVSDIWQNTITEYSNVNGTPRQYFTQHGLEIFKDNPIFGIGYGTYGNNEVRLRTNDLIFQKYGLYYWDAVGLSTSDTFYAGVLPEFGMVGLAIALLFGRDIFRKYKKITDLSPITKTYLLMILAGLFLGLNSSSPLYNPHVGGLIWIGIGLLYSDYMKYKGSSN